MSTQEPLKVLTVPPQSKHTASVIFVHGLGDTGHGWKPVADMFRVDPGLRHVKWIFPHSPVKSVTANMGMAMPSWFDVISFGFDAPEDEEGMLESAHALNQLIHAEVESGIDPSRIVLGGFSQGGAMSLLTGFTTEAKLGGIVVLSGWLLLRDKFKSMVREECKGAPIFWGHGDKDPLVRYQFGRASAEFLKMDLGIPEAPSPSPDAKPEGLDFRTYHGVDHSTNSQELDDLRSWLKRVIPQEV